MKILIIIFSMIICGNVNAENWQQLFDDNKDGWTSYVDNDRVYKKDNMVEITLLTNFNKSSTFAAIGAKSTVQQVQFDCKRKMAKRNTMVWYSGDSGRGDIVNTSEPSKWSKLVPDSSYHHNWKTFCKN